MRRYTRVRRKTKVARKYGGSYRRRMYVKPDGLVKEKIRLTFDVVAKNTTTA